MIFDVCERKLKLGAGFGYVRMHAYVCVAVEGVHRE